MEPLSTISEIAIAITGFTAVATVIGTRTGGWSANDRQRLRVLVRTSLIVLFASFLPELVAELVSDDDLVWRICNGALGIAILADVVWTFTRGMQPTNLHRFLGLGAVILIVLLIVSAAGVLEAFRLIYLLSLLFMLSVALTNFVELLISSTQRSPSED
jgi:hypothetical protein